jgi:uncharacterized protein with von Willebrand factor type A (vWA) domain
MSCRFRGSFTSGEKERLEKTARAVERFLSREARSQPAWAFLHFQAPYAGYSYWGVRYEDGLQVGAETAEELAASLASLRVEMRRKRERRRRERTQGGVRPGTSSEPSTP